MSAPDIWTKSQFLTCFSRTFGFRGALETYSAVSSLHNSSEATEYQWHKETFYAEGSASRAVWFGCRIIE